MILSSEAVNSFDATLALCMFHKARLYGSGLNRGVTLILQRHWREWREVRMGSVSARISKSCLTFSLLSCKFQQLIFWTKNNVFAKRQKQTPLVLQLQKACRRLCRHHFKRSNTSMLTLHRVSYGMNTFEYFISFLASFNGNKEIHIIWLPYLKDYHYIFLSAQ